MSDPNQLSQDASGNRPEKPADVFDLYLREDDEDRRSLRVSVIVAVLVHIGLLAVTLPAMSGPVIAEPEASKVFVIANTRFQRPPPPPPPEREPLETKAVPMPDETPHEEEPLRLEDPVPVTKPVRLDPTTLQLPDAPPALPEVPIMVGAGVERPERISYVDPVYPEIARKVRREGIVILEAIIDKSGSVRDLKVLKSGTLGLTEAALEAVGQWTYEPSVMNGKPVEVRMTVTVNFRLQ